MTCKPSPYRQPEPRQRNTPMLLLSACLLISPIAAHAGDDGFMQVWRRPKTAAAATQTAPQPTPAGPASPVPAAPPAAVSAAESTLALSALHDEQTRLSTIATAQSEASLARTAELNENLHLVKQTPAPARTNAPPPPPAVMPGPNTSAPDVDRPVSTNQAARPNKTNQRAGLLAQMLQDSPDKSNTATLTEGALKQSFFEAVRRASERTPQLRQIYAEYLAAQSDVDQAKGQRWPQITLTGQTREHYFGSNVDAQYNPGNAVGINISTTLFDWGQTRKTIDSRKQLVSANEAHYRAQLEDLAYQVTSTMLELARQRNIVALNEQFVDRMRRLTQMLSDIADVDKGRRSELVQAKARLLQAEASRDAAQSKARDAELALQKLVGPSSVPVPKASIWPIANADLKQLLSKVDQHPSVQQASAQAQAADLTTEATRASSRPKLAWVVSANSGRDVVGLRQPWQTMVTVNWPLFSGGSQRAATSAAQYRAEAQWQNVAQQKLDLEYQLRTANTDALDAFQRADQYHQLSQKTDEIRKGFFEQWYQLGQRSLLDVLSAESDYYSNRINEVSNRFDGYQSVMREQASAGDLVNWLRSERTP